MKALILSAGLGNRLRPYTDYIPKPLFPVSGQPLLDRLIRHLVSAGCTEVALNTHHLHHMIDAFLSTQSYGISVFTRYEPVLLGTGGAIKNLSDFWDDRPFFVVNSDILTDIDFRSVYEFHNRHTASATLVLTDSPELNSVSIDSDERIRDFHKAHDIAGFPPPATFTFTGIQVLDPSILTLIPDNTFSSSIDLYRKLIGLNQSPRAYMALSSQWTDLGTPDRYKSAVRDFMARDAFQEAYGCSSFEPFDWILLDGDGSDKSWYRIQSANVSIVAVDNGIRTDKALSEIGSFVSIGHHLNSKGLPVPELYRHDLFSGWVFMKDFGDTHLQTIICEKNDPDYTRAIYQNVLDVLIRFSTLGIEGFDNAWAYESISYDASLILGRECNYFVDAFLRGYIGHDIDNRAFETDFRQLATGALENAVSGLMHRDFQSRNIMIYHGEPHIIDFQGARLGPIQYDMASLLIDPYAALSPALQEELFDYAMSTLLTKRDFNPEGFRKCYEYCRVTRNLQILGAFAFLTRVKGKRSFEKYIPPALKSLKTNLRQLDTPAISALMAYVELIEIGDNDGKD